MQAVDRITEENNVQMLQNGTKCYRGRLPPRICYNVRPHEFDFLAVSQSGKVKIKNIEDFSHLRCAVDAFGSLFDVPRDNLYNYYSSITVESARAEMFLVELRSLPYSVLKKKSDNEFHRVRDISVSPFIAEYTTFEGRERLMLFLKSQVQPHVVGRVKIVIAEEGRVEIMDFNDDKELQEIADTFRKFVNYCFYEVVQPWHFPSRHPYPVNMLWSPPPPPHQQSQDGSASASAYPSQYQQQHQQEQQPQHESHVLVTPPLSAYAVADASLRRPQEIPPAIASPANAHVFAPPTRILHQQQPIQGGYSN